MSNIGTAGALYAVTTSPASVLGAVPEDAKEKRHHLKDGKGFINPWESFKMMSTWGIIRTMIGYFMINKTLKSRADVP